MNKKQKKTLNEIFKQHTLSKINWPDIEFLLIALGAEIPEGKGSRVRINLNDIRAVFHRPHPQNETNKGSVNSVRRFLENAGVEI